MPRVLLHERITFLVKHICLAMMMPWRSICFAMFRPGAEAQMATGQSDPAFCQ